MVNHLIFFLLLVPLALSLASYPILRKPMGPQNAVVFSAIGFFVGVLIICAAVYGGKGYKLADTEVWNGEITGKERIHDTYEQPYSCNCSRDSNGNESCQTCYETHYTVEWKAYSNLEDFQIDKLDRTSRRVYQSPDPEFYKGIQNGDPVAVTRMYKNYIKAVPETILRPRAENLKEKFTGSIPEYPMNIYNFYNVDRVLPVGVSIPDLRDWNKLLAQKLKVLGPKHQANIVIVVTKIEDPNYFYALQDAWINGKKNDIVVVIGAPEFPKQAAWVNIMALTTTDLFQVQLRDALMEIPELTATAVINVIDEQVRTNFQRKRMREFEYLDAQIDPPTWLVVTAILLNIVAYAGFWIYAHVSGANNVFTRGRYFGSRRFVYR